MYFKYLFAVVLPIVTRSSSFFNLTILHTNDVHCHYDEYKAYATECDSQGSCFGGISRRATLTKKLRDTYENTILLDGGYVLTRTLWYFAWNGEASAAFINQLNYDAIVPGNHEFDGGYNLTFKYFDSINKNISIVASNIDAPGRYDSLFRKTATLKVANETIGICGYVITSTANLLLLQTSMPGPNVTFHDEVQSVRKCSEELHNQGINKIVALGHAGINIDIRIAKEVDHVDVVVGGHTNTFLYNGVPPSTEKVYGPYPLKYMVNGTTRLVVQANAYGKYLGKLHIGFNRKGEVETWSGNPILIDNKLKKDEDMMNIKQKFETKVRNLAQEQIAILETAPIDSLSCRKQQCMMGNLICDAIASYINSTLNERVVVLWTASSLLMPFKDKLLTEGNLFMTMPYQDNIYIVTIKGKYLLQALSISAQDRGGYNFLISSGVKYILKIKPNSVQVENVRVIDSDNTFRDIDLEASYKVAVSRYMFLFNVYKLFRERGTTNVRKAFTGFHAVKSYLKGQGIVRPALDGRLEIINNTNRASILDSSFGLMIATCLTTLLVTVKSY